MTIIPFVDAFRINERCLNALTMFYGRKATADTVKVAATALANALSDEPHALAWIDYGLQTPAAVTDQPLRLVLTEAALLLKEQYGHISAGSGGQAPILGPVGDDPGTSRAIRGPGD